MKEIPKDRMYMRLNTRQLSASITEVEPFDIFSKIWNERVMDLVSVKLNLSVLTLSNRRVKRKDGSASVLRTTKNMQVSFRDQWQALAYYVRILGLSIKDPGQTSVSFATVKNAVEDCIAHLPG